MRRTFGQIILAAVLLAIAFATGPQAFAQTVRGTIAGSITDASGAAVPDATVTAVGDENGNKSTTKSTSAGVYRFPNLQIGRYTVTVTAQGFQTKVSKGVPVQVNSTSALDVQLANGSVSDTVTVDATAPRIETESSEIGGTVSNKQIEDLPLSLALGVNGMRSPETFVFLVPGTTGPGSAPQGNSTNGVFFARLSGGQAYGNETLLDGASVQRSENGSSFDETSPSIEVLQEFKVTTSTPSAEFGRTTSGITSFSTKSGTNDFHGIGFLIHKNRIFDANGWFANGYKAQQCAGVPDSQCLFSRGFNTRWDYGGTLNGPVRIPKLYDGRNRSFFTFAWEKYKYQPSNFQFSTVPTALERTGDFSDVLGGPVPGGSPYPGVAYNVLLNPCTGTPVLFNQIFDPRTSRQISPGVFCRTPFAGNKINTPLSSTATKLIAGLPLPNQAPQTTDVFGYNGNYVQRGLRPFFNTTYTIRIDQTISDRNKVFATYDTRQNYSLTAAPNLPPQFNSSGFPQTFTTHYSRAGWDFTITPTLLNHLNLGYNRTNSVNLGASLNSPNTLASLGVPNDYSQFAPLLVFPSPDQPTTLGQQQNGQNIDNGSRINDSITWTKGRQSMKLGGDFRYQQYSVIQYNQDTLNFYRDQTAALNFACCGSGHPIASFLLGEVGSASQAVFNVHPRWNSHYWALFFEDDIKFTRNLTDNLGLRNDVDAPRHEALNRTSSLSLTAPNPAAGNRPGAFVFGTNCGGCNTAWANTWYKDIAPRLGFAYVLPGTNGKAVLRGGGAVLYGPLQYSDFGGAMALGFNQNRGFSTPQNPAANTGGAFTPAFRLDSSSAADPTNASVGFPSVSYAPNTDPTQLTVQGNPQAIGGQVILPQNGRPSMTNNWSLQLQDELAQDLILTIGYIGQVAQNLHSGFLSNINNISESAFSYGDRLNLPGTFIPVGGSAGGVNAPYSSYTGSLGQALRPFPQYDFIAGDCCLENLGHSSYNAMVVSLARRFRNGFNLQASYTWAKTLTDADSTIPFSYVTGNGGNGLRQGQGSSNLRLNKAVSVQNIPQTLSLSYLYQLPFGKGRKWANSNRALDLLIGGWEVGGIHRYQSGSPVSFGCAGGIPYYQNCITYTAGPASNGGKDFASDAYKRNKNGPNYFNQQSWFKPAFRKPGTAQTGGGSDPGVSVANAAFIDQNNPNGPIRNYTPACAALNGGQPCSFDAFSLGNISRVTTAITGPMYLAEDLSLIKEFHIQERFRFQLKGEAFDVLNRHRMALPDSSPNDVCPVGGSGCQGFGVPTGTDYGPRTMQVSGKIFF